MGQKIEKMQELQSDLVALVVRVLLLALGIVAVAFAAVVAAALSVVLVPLLVLSGGRHSAWRPTWIGRLRGVMAPRAGAARRRFYV